MMLDLNFYFQSIKYQEIIYFMFSITYSISLRPPEDLPGYFRGPIGLIEMNTSWPRYRYIYIYIYIK